MGAIQAWISNNGIAAGGIGILLLTTLIGYLIKKIDENKLFAWAGGLGAAFDKILVVKFDWLDEIIEETGIMGIIPIVVGFYVGMINGNQKLRASMKAMLLALANKIPDQK